MKLFIIGLDGLEYNLVVRWKLNYYKQKAYGKHYVGFFKTLYTPIIWASMITGINVEEVGYNEEYIKNVRMKKFFSFLYPIYVIRKKLIKRKLGLRKFIKKNKVPYTPNIPESLKEKSFIYYLRKKGYKVYTNEIPGFDEKRNEYYRWKTGKILNLSIVEKSKLVNEALKDVSNRCADAINYVIKDYDLVFVYSPLPDIAYHMVTKPTLKKMVWLRNIHYKLYETVKPLIMEAEKRNYVVLILSDHGFDFKKYYHSDYGFWSLNIEPPSYWNIKTILDFKEYIIRLVLKNIL